MRDREKGPGRGLYLLAGLSGIVAIVLLLLELVAGIFRGNILTSPTLTAADRFLQFANSSLLGLYNLDLLNVVIALLLIPVFFVLTIAHSRINKYWALLGLIVFLVGATSLVSDNVAFPMFELSKKYALADNEAQKDLYASAGEAMLARGVHGSAGMFFSYLVSYLGGLIVSLVMLKGRIFTRTNSWIGVAGFTLMLLSVILGTFISGGSRSAQVFGRIGGILLLLWLILVCIKIFKERKRKMEHR